MPLEIAGSKSQGNWGLDKQLCHGNVLGFAQKGSATPKNSGVDFEVRHTISALAHPKSYYF